MKNEKRIPFDRRESISYDVFKALGYNQRVLASVKRTELSRHLARIGAKGGSATSEAKAAAARENAKRAGKPGTGRPTVLIGGEPVLIDTDARWVYVMDAAAPELVRVSRSRKLADAAARMIGPELRRDGSWLGKPLFRVE